MLQRFTALVAAAIALVAAVVVTHRSDRVPTMSHPLGKLAPTPGPNADGYVDGKRAYLSRLAGREPDAAAAGLASFSRLLRPSEVEQVTAGLRVSVVFTMFPGAQPEAPRVVTTVAAAVAKRAAEIAAQTEAEIASLQARNDPASAPLVADRRRELHQTTPDCACVYAAVVERTTVAKLAALQRSALVRLVDLPDPLTDDLSGWELTPIAPRSS
jgi:hypothetical protein